MKNPIGKNLKYIALAYALSGCAVHQTAKPTFIYVEKQKKVAVAIDDEWTQRAKKKDLDRLGYSWSSTITENFNRLESKCSMECSGKMIVGPGITYDNRAACRQSCLRASGWELLKIEEDLK